MTDRGQWIILRTSNAHTLRLADSLNAAGIACWTPREKVSKRVGKQRRQRSDLAPLTPSFVFAPASHTAELFALSNSPTMPSVQLDGDRVQIPGFWVFHRWERIPLVADRDLTSLREAEHKTMPKAKVRQWQDGDDVRVVGGGFDGLTGKVEAARGKFALVHIPGFSMPIKIDACLLLSDVAKGEVPLARRAA